MSDEISDYDYDLPTELIAREPPRHREQARLLVVDRASGRLEHSRIAELPDLLRRSDLLVLNDTRVVPARLLGRRAATGGHWEGLFLECLPGGTWRLMCQTRGKLRPGETIDIVPAHEPASTDLLSLQLLEHDEEGIWLARPPDAGDAFATLERFGSVPLPPYMGRKLARPEDFERYQTAFARHRGSVAAPTAGLHFSGPLLERCAVRDIGHAFVTLHVGIGTFRPMTAERLSEHKMHAEWCEVPEATAAAMAATRAAGGRVVAVGTTTVRTLETAARAGAGQVAAWRGSTNLFIRPPFEFRVVDTLLTNFHLPRSTLLALVSAFAGRELMLRAYHEAIAEKYRFYSYGDAMLIV